MWWRGRNSQHAEASINETTPTTSNATLKSVHLAAADHNYPALREAIIQWARNHWQQTSIHTLDQVALKAQDAELKLLFEELDMRLYDKHPLTVKTGVNNDLNSDAPPQESSDEKIFDTKALIKHLEAIHQIPTGSKKTKLTELRPLYPE